MPAVLAPRARSVGRGSWLAGYEVLRLTGPFLGFNSYQSPDTIPQGGRGIVQSPDVLNVYSYPFGSMTSFPGHANINGTAANSSKAITGLTFEGEIAQNLIVAVQNKIGEDVSGTWTDRTGSLTITDDDDNLADFAFLNSRTVVAFLKKDSPAIRASGSGNFAALGGSPRSGVKGCFAWDGRMWLVSDQNVDFSARNDPESYDTTDDTLNFLTTTGAGASDGSIITSWTVVGDSVYIGKEGANAIVGHLFRIYRTGEPSTPYAFERIPTGGVAPIASKAALSLPNGDFMFFAKDGNTYIMRGNVLIPIGRNIQRTILADYNKSRFEFASMGLLRERGYVGLSLSLGSDATHSRIWWYDYLNSIPGRQELEIWYPTTHVINAWGERISSGQRQLVTGGYDGFYERHLSGDSYAGSAYTKRYTTPWLLLGDYFQVYHVLGVVIVFEPLGDYNITLNYKTDFSTSFTSAGTFNTKGGAVLGSFVLGTDVLGGQEQDMAYLTLNTVARRLQLQMVNSSDGQPFNLHAIYLLVKPIYRGVNV